MYPRLRNTHLILGLFLFWVILMYGVSAVQMAHQIRITPTVAESDISTPAGLEARALATHLMSNLALTGEMGKPNPTPTGFQFAIIRAGGQTQVRYESSTGKTHLRTTDTGILGTLNRLHHFHGLHNQTGARNAWG